MAEIASYLEIILLLVILIGGVVVGWFVGRHREYSFIKAAAIATFFAIAFAIQLPAYVILIWALEMNMNPAQPTELTDIFDHTMDITYGLAIVLVVVWVPTSFLAVYLARRKEYLRRRKSRRKK